MQEKQVKPAKETLKPTAIPVEVHRVSRAWVRHATFGMPVRMLRSLWSSPALAGAMDETKVLSAFSESVLQLFDDLGPIYGKAGQVALSRLSPKMHAVADRLHLTRLYSDWPAIPFAQVKKILDQEAPTWRSELQLDPIPLGVASMAQVHAATDRSGRQWVVKIIKPQARGRLLETISALEQLMLLWRPFAVTMMAKRSLRELGELCEGFRRELDLSREADTIERVAKRICDENREGLLRIPQIRKDFCTKQVLTIERFHGDRLSDIVSGQKKLTEAQQKKLAKGILKELLVQVFEMGLFHADPHAGNLILLEDGSVGIFDWGLAGELRETDRRHIAEMLKAVISVDLERLISVLQEMATGGGKKVARKKIEKELRKVIAVVKLGQEDPSKKPSLQFLIESCLRAADRLGIPIPSGLLLMAKSLITIEGLAKGIDPKISMALVATPVLFRAAKPSLGDMLQFARKFPGMAKQMFFK